MNGVPVFKRNNEDMITFLPPVGIFFFYYEGFRKSRTFSRGVAVRGKQYI